MLAGAENFLSAEAAEGKSPLASKLFALKGIAAVMVGKTFVTVTLSDQDALTELNEQIIETIKTFLATGQKAVIIESKPTASETSNLSEIEKQIVTIIDNEIRPAVAMDGGDITFEKFDDGVVFLHMKGSCAGCPSSTATLKMGIENRLKDSIPEVREVVAV